MFHYYTPWKCQESLWFSDFFWGGGGGIEMGHCAKMIWSYTFIDNKQIRTGLELLCDSGKNQHLYHPSSLILN